MSVLEQAERRAHDFSFTNFYDYICYKIKVCKNPIWSDKYYSRADIFQDNGIRKNDPAQGMVKGFTKEMAWNLVLEN